MRDEDRAALADVVGHGIMIGVDQRLVLCTCGWRDHDEANLTQPLGKWRLHVADALLPVVDAIARRRAAEELRKAAEWLPDSSMVSDYDRRNGATRPDARDWLRARADALDSQ